MSGRATNALGALPIPGEPIVDATGRITPTWYRLIVALVARTGGSAGRVTPIAQDPQTLLMSLMEPEAPEAPGMVWFPQDVGQGAGQDSGGGVGWGLQDTARAQGQSLVLGDVAKSQGTALQLADPQRPQFDPVFYPATSNPGAVEGVTVGASPYTYTAGVPGWVLVSGGTVTGVTWSRDGATFLATGQIAGFFPLEVTDSIVITYTVAPTVSFLRRAK